MQRSKGISPAGPHGGDGPAVARALGVDSSTLLDLSQTLNPFASDIVALAGKYLGALRTYPDRQVATALLAEAMGIDRARLLLTNGGSEAISLVSQIVGGTVRSEPEFALHPRSERGPIWRSDPHSPSGRLAGVDEVAEVWDEAFLAMATGQWTRGRPGIVVGSLTKLFACPGLRLGYIIADDIERFAAVQPLWSVNSLALAMVPALLESADLPGWADDIAEARTSLVQLFDDRGFTVLAADAPWILVEAPGLRERLIPFGIVVRDCASFGLPSMARVSVTDAPGRARLASALDRLAPV